MYTLEPFVGFDDVKFGMTPKQVQEKLGREPEKFQKTADCKQLTDDYGDFLVYYNDETGAFEAVEFHNGSKEDVEFQGIHPFAMPYKDLEDTFSSMDADIDIDDDGFVSEKFGIAVYAPYGDEDAPEGGTQSFLLYERGYYD